MGVRPRNLRVPPMAAGLTFGAAIGAMLVVAVVALQPAAPSFGCNALECGSLSLSWGVPLNETASEIVGCPSLVGHYCYSIEIAGSALGVTGLNLSLRNSSGRDVKWPRPPSTDAVSLISSQNTGVALYNTTDQTWTAFGNDTYILGGYSIVIFTGGVGLSFGLRGYQLVASLSGPDGRGTIPSIDFP